MPFIRAFGKYLPSRVVTNAEIGPQVGADNQWIIGVSGIEERRYAASHETVASMATAAAQDCLQRAALPASDLGLILVATGSAERRFPGPAVTVARNLGLDSVPALDIPIASAGSLFGMALAANLCQVYGHALVIGSEKMSSVVSKPPMERGVAILFGDGAGACLVSPDSGQARIVDSAIYSDGAFAEDLKLDFDAPLAMNGRSVILQASRKIPRAIQDLLDKHGRPQASVEVFLMHQANRNLIVRIAQALGVPEDRFYSNIASYGNTSSASMLIAAAEWSMNSGFKPGIPVIFAAFGAGFHWGAMLAEGV